MNINFSKVHISTNSNQAPNDEIHAQGSAKNQAVSDIMALKAGDSFEGVITDVRDGQVTIKLAGNGELTARLIDAVKLNIGEQTTFLVKENNGEQIAIKPVNGSGYADQLINKVLQETKVLSTDKNMNIIKSLIENGMPVDKNTILTISRQSSASNIDDVIFLNKHNIPVNDNNIEQLNNYRNYEGQIASTMDDMASDAANTFTELSSGDGGVFSEIYDTFTKAVLGSENIKSDIAVNAQISDVVKDNKVISDSAVSSEAFENTEETNAVDKMSVDKTSIEVSDSKSQADIMKGNNVNDRVMTKLDTDIKPFEALASEEAVVTEGIDKSTKAAVIRDVQDATMPQAMKEADNTSGKTHRPISEVIGDDKQLMSIIKDSSLSTEAKSVLMNTNQSTEQFLNNLNNIIKSEPDKKVFKDIFSSKSYRDILKDVLESKYRVDIEKFDKENVSKTYRQLYDMAKSINDILTKTGQIGTKLYESASQVKNNLDFMNNLNTFMGYVQIPLKMTDKKMDSELYVYANRKSLAKNKDSVTAFLHLDMENIRSVDIYVKLAKNVVDMKFYMEDEELVRFVESNKDTLVNALQVRGYASNMSVSVSEKKKSFTELVNNNDNNEIKRYTFDIRA